MNLKQAIFLINKKHKKRRKRHYFSMVVLLLVQSVTDWNWQAETFTTKSSETTCTKGCESLSSLLLLLLLWLDL